MKIFVTRDAWLMRAEEKDRAYLYEHVRIK